MAVIDHHFVAQEYDYRADLARHPGWSLRIVPYAEDAEKFIWPLHMIILRESPSWDLAVAHALAHLDLEHFVPNGFSDDQEAAADELARHHLEWGITS